MFPKSCNWYIFCCLIDGIYFRLEVLLIEYIGTGILLVEYIGGIGSIIGKIYFWIYFRYSNRTGSVHDHLNNEQFIEIWYSPKFSEDAITLSLFLNIDLANW